LLFGRCPIVHTPHTFAFAFKGHFSFWKRALFMDIERSLGRRTRRIVHVSESERLEWLSFGIVPAERAAVVENGIDPWPYRWSEPPEPKVALFSDGKPSYRIGTIGLLNAAKGHDGLLRAFRRLLETYPDARLAIIGEGELRPRLEALIRELELQGRARLAGYRNDIPSALKEMDLFVFPSLWEGMPYVVLEAMAAGLPVVATDGNGSRDIVRHGETGLLVPPGDEAALARACGEVLSKPNTAAAMAREALRLVMSRYTLEGMLSRMEALYREVVSEGAGE